ncbi:MAG: hypothetical protein M1821_000734 [Bathelium mastoideum]|nr:MAG: hypothetical protein M1821_000734 [Bathelium mastoideum]
MATSPSIVKLSEIIRDGVTEISDFLEKNKISPTSFSIDSPLVLDLAPDQAVARETVLAALDELHSLLIGPLPTMMKLSAPGAPFMSLHAIQHFKIAQNVGLNEEVSYEELSRRCKINFSDLRRFMRQAIAYRIFSEPRKGFVTHTANSRIFLTNPGFDQWVSFICEELIPSSVKAVPAMAKWPEQNDEAHTGFALANGTQPRSFFDIIGSDSARASRFSTGMTMIRSQRAFDSKYLLDNLNWSGNECPQTVVDIGGSHGTLGIELLARFPAIQKYISQDLPTVIESAPAIKAFEDRFQFQVYDFFTEQPVRGADVYFFRQILHDWTDAKSIEILSNQVSAMQPGKSTIILNEICLPDPGILTIYQEQSLRGFDLAMKHFFNSKERDAEEWAQLLASVDPRLKIYKIISPPGSLMSIIEVHLREA